MYRGTLDHTLDQHLTLVPDVGRPVQALLRRPEQRLEHHAVGLGVQLGNRSLARPRDERRLGA